MKTFIMLGKYSSEAVKGISAERTQEAQNVIKKFSGEISCIYALLGEYDLMIVASFPAVEEAIKASLSLNKLTGISFSTSPAITVEEFDRISSSL